MLFIFCGGVMNRCRLAFRRLSAAAKIKWRGRTLHVTAGFADDGRVLEVFAKGPKEGSDVAAMIDENCILISKLLQYGCPPAEIAGGVMRAAGGHPETITGRIVDAFCELAADVEIVKAPPATEAAADRMPTGPFLNPFANVDPWG